MNYQSNRAFNNPGGNRGFTLIELLITLVVGMIVLAGITAFATKVLQVNSAVLRSARLNQDLGTTLQVMVNDIRRAGYEGYDLPAGLPKDSKGIFGDPNEYDIAIRSAPDSTSNDCILYAYDQRDYDPNNKVTIDPEERLGFRLTNGAIQSRRDCDAADCDIDCSLGTWEDITDPDAITITSLSFDTEGSKCKNMSNSDYWITIDDTPLIDTDDATGFPCTATDGTNLQSYTQNSATPPTYESSSFDPPDVGATTEPPIPHETVETRQVNIRLEGKVKRPARFEDTASIKNLEVSIKIRNDRVCLHYPKDDYRDDVPVCAH